jgi:hydroxymethylglutaryl-CoA reductase
MFLMVKRGGGLKDITVRPLKRPDGGFAGVVHLHVNVCDAMGANTVTQLCEYLRPFIEEKTGEKALLSILSNYTESRFTTASVTFDDFDAGVGQKIAEASLIAEIDPYRAVTHNKGIINGIDALTIATGNDHRAVSAALHSFATKEGHYRPLSAWMYENKRLTGVFKGPIPVGIVGGVTALHPFAKIALKMMLVTSSSELSNVIGSIGLLQNFAALHALTTDGLIKGHMSLHLNNMIMQADAHGDERHELYLKLKQQLSLKKTIHMHDVVKVLDDLRKK